VRSSVIAITDVPLFAALSASACPRFATTVPNREMYLKQSLGAKLKFPLRDIQQPW
jgi:hypothetical protein